MTGSPAAPQLTTEQYRAIFETLSLNPTAENRPIREEIGAFLAAQTAWQDDARRRNIDNPW